MNKAWLVVVCAAVGCGSPPPSNQLSGRPNPRPTLTEVALYYVAADSTNRVLRIDPAHVDLMFFEDSARSTYFTGVGMPAAALSDVSTSDLARTGTQVFRDQRGEPTDTAHGFQGTVTLRANGRWFRLSNVTRARELVLYYEAGDSLYRLMLPLRSSTVPDNAPADSTVDVVFWNSTATQTYRQGLAAKGRAVSDPARQFPNGIYVVESVRPDGRIFTNALYMPRADTEGGAFRGISAEICYHFESCQWVCSGN